MSILSRFADWGVARGWFGALVYFSVGFAVAAASGVAVGALMLILFGGTQ